MAGGTDAGIIDTHVHVWERARFHYHWMQAGSAFDRDFTFAALYPEMRALGITGGILIEATNTPEEIDWLLELTAGHASAWGIIGWLDLEDPAGIGRLTRLAANSTFKGVRLNWLASRPDFTSLHDGMAALKQTARVLEILVDYRLIPEVARFSQAYPHQRVVIEHAAGVDMAHEPVQAWRAAVQPLAACPNTYLKLSGLGKGEMLAPAVTRAYVAAALDLFGAQRLLFGSNYPFCADYARHLQDVTDVLATLAPFEQRAILHDSAAALYELTSRNEVL